MAVLPCSGAIFVLLAALPTMGEALFVSQDLQDSKSNPLQKVATLLKDMQMELKKEQENDESVYDAMECWCETNDKAKTKAIADAQRRVSDLSSSALELGAKSGQLQIDIGELKKEIEANENALNSATSIREKEAGEFHETEKDAIVNIGNLKSAVSTLGQQHPAALDQTGMLQLGKLLKNHLTDEMMQRLSMAPSARSAVAAFVQQPALLQAGSPQSGQIFGILKGMKESFEANLAKGQNDEEEASSQYAEMRGAKQEELAAANTQLGGKEASLADTDDKHAEDKADAEDTQNQLDADSEFLADLKQRCGSMDQQWAERQKVRQEETKAVGVALEILMDDDARDLMSKTLSFSQISLRSRRARSWDEAARQKAAAVLRTAARVAEDPKMSVLAVAMQGGVFTRVKESIDAMTTQLKSEQKEEVEKKDWCIQELHKNDMHTSDAYEVKSDLETRIESLTDDIQQMADLIVNLQAEVEDSKVEMKRASENRLKENKAFQATVSDQRVTQEILHKAMSKLQDFYSKRASLLSRKSKQGAVAKGAASRQAPPPGFTKYKKQGGGGVIGMIQNIIAESKAVEAEAQHGEQQAQSAYEQFMSDSKKAMKALMQEIVDKQENKAAADQDLVLSNTDAAANAKDIERLDQYKKELHASCDYVMDNFDTRQTARVQEMDALQQAKSILSGADLSF